MFGNSGDGEISENIISNNTVIANFNLGGGILIYSPNTLYNISIQGNIISNNNGGAGGGLCIDYAENAPLKIIANMFLDNIGTKGGGLYTRKCHNMLISNNVFAYNIASEIGGAIQMFDFQDNDDFQYLSDTIHPLLVNNTFAFNNCDIDGGAISCQHFWETPVIFNSIFYGNSALHDGNDIYYAGPGEVVVSYSDIDTINNIYIDGSGSCTGEGNINEDPQFLLSAYHPFSLDEDSPCIDVGSQDTTGLMLKPWDIAKNSRIWDGNYDGDTIIDMGAYEYGAPLWVTINEHAYSFNLARDNINLFPNPAQKAINIISEDQLIQEVIIFSMNGKQVLRQKPVTGFIDISYLRSGVYVVEVILKNDRIRKKLIVQ